MIIAARIELGIGLAERLCMKDIARPCKPGTFPPERLLYKSNSEDNLEAQRFQRHRARP
jgi:hypothetical protein